MIHKYVTSTIMRQTQFIGLLITYLLQCTIEVRNLFGVCCSSARDILDAYYQGRFVLVNERDLEKFL